VALPDLKITSGTNVYAFDDSYDADNAVTVKIYESDESNNMAGEWRSHRRTASQPINFAKRKRITQTKPEKATLPGKGGLKAKMGKYPASLDELVPIAATALPEEPATIWGWLYTATDDDFTLGYVYGVDKLGYSVCVYSAQKPEWDCLPNYSTGPFILEPTPTSR
jgi:hypothetical protein